MARIECRGLVKRFRSTIAVERLDLAIEDGEFVVLLGPSGCGKTTTLNMIAGLEDESEGEIWLGGRLVNGVPPHQRNIAMVFQSYALYPQKSVYDNIAFPLQLRGARRGDLERAVRQVAEQLEITPLLARRPAELSGGQRQRVALGRAIVREPTAFLMDEPLSNLDAALRLSMRTLIKRLHQDLKTTFVYVTHDQAEAMTMADRIVVMHQGKVQQIGTPDDIYERPRNLFVASFLGSPPMNFLEGEITALDGVPAFRRGDFVMPLGAGRATIGAVSGPVVLGVRPEDAGVETTNGVVVNATTLMVSPLGSEIHVNVKVAGVEMVFRLPKGRAVEIGQPIELRFDPRRAHLFDRSSGRSLAAPA
jgi:multiple sugar transport system ATP-binding protein